MKPILFNTEMVRAILEGRKTVTRRVVKPQPQKETAIEDRNYEIISMPRSDDTKGCGVAPYELGDVLYIRETWNEWTGGYVYKAWCEPFPQAGYCSSTGWKPSIHMPKEAARIFIRVTGVRVERLQEITKEDIEKEGLIDFCKKCKALFSECDTCMNEGGIVEDFKDLWNSTIKADQLKYYGWESNPYVWVIEFERIEKPELAAVQEG